MPHDRGDRTVRAGRGVIEADVDIAVPPAEVFAIYRDVANWSAWDPDTLRASLQGPFTVGTTGELVPALGRPVGMTIVALEPDRAFTVEVRIPLFRMRFDHELTQFAGGTRALHRVTFSGLLAPLLGRHVGGPLRQGLPVTMQGLKQYAEQRIAIR